MQDPKGGDLDPEMAAYFDEGDRILDAKLFDDDRTNVVQFAPKGINGPSSAPPQSDPQVVFAKLLAIGTIIGYDALLDATAVKPIPIWYDGIENDSIIEISGPSGHGKTTLATLLIAARANPTDAPVDLLGRPVTPGPPGSFVVVIEEENGRWSLRRKMEVACEALGLPVRDTLDRCMFLVRKGVRANSPEWRVVEELGALGMVSMLVVDSRARVLRRVGARPGASANDEEEQAIVAEVCHRFIETAKCPMVVISHTRKGKDGSVPDDIEDVAGSGQRGAGDDVLLIVTATKSAAGQVESAKVKFAKLREAVDEHPEPVEFQLAKDPDGRYRIVMSVVGGGAKTDRRPLDVRCEELLKAAPKGLTKNAMLKALRVSRGDNSLEDVITDMFRQGTIRRVERLYNGRKFDAFIYVDPDVDPEAS